MPAARMGKSNGKRATPEEAKRSVKRLLHYSTKYYPFEFWMSIFCIIFSGITGVLPMVFIGVVVDEISSILDKTYTVTLASLGLSINNVSLQLIGTQIVVIACILVAGLAANYFYNFLMSRLAQGVQKRIRDDLFNHMQAINGDIPTMAHAPSIVRSIAKVRIRRLSVLRFGDISLEWT